MNTSTGWFVVTRGTRKTFLRLAVSAADYTRAARRFLTDTAGNRWTVRKRIG